MQLSLFISHKLCKMVSQEMRDKGIHMLQHHMAALGHLGLVPHNTRPAQGFLDNGGLVVVAGGTSNGGLQAKLDSAERQHDLEPLHKER